MFSDIVSVLALIVSAVAFWQTMRLNRVAYYTEMAQVEARLSDLPGALRFHGLAKEDLLAVGLALDEFAYLLNSFTLGSTRHQVLSRSTKPFRPGTYRYNMCKSEATRRAWPLIKMMMNTTDFVKAIDRTIERIEAEERSARSRHSDGTSEVA